MTHTWEQPVYIHAWRSPHIQQTSDSSWEFLKIENEQIKTAQKIRMDKKLREITYLCVEIINSRRQAKGKLGHVVQVRFCRFT